MKPAPDPVLERQLEEYAARWAQIYSDTNVGLDSTAQIAVKWGEMDSNSVIFHILADGRETKYQLTRRVERLVAKHYGLLKRLTD